jgi:DNA-binding response OmpR family regulator
MTKILLIEPDILLAQSYAKALEVNGYDVSLATTAQSAITVCDKINPGAIVMELQMANHNGIEFLYEFRSYPEWQDIPVIVLSMIPPVEFKVNSVLWKELSIKDYLYKPHTTLSKLVDSIQSLVPAVA